MVLEERYCPQHSDFGCGASRLVCPSFPLICYGNSRRLTNSLGAHLRTWLSLTWAISEGQTAWEPAPALGLSSTAQMPLHKPWIPTQSARPGHLAAKPWGPHAHGALMTCFVKDINSRYSFTAGCSCWLYNKAVSSSKRERLSGPFFPFPLMTTIIWFWK